ncbi:MAG: glycosyltransferase family 4 protein [Candidatus Korobacteraceae bacterium]
MSTILLSAYACEPGKGSEPAVGWMWATELAASGHQVWVLTRDSNRSAIEAGMPSPGPACLHFEYCDLPRYARGWKKLPGAIYLYYFLWQALAFRAARRLNRAHHFDRVHHVSFVSLRAPSFMGWLGIPFYFGPLSGGECVPQDLRRGMTRRARAFEFARDCANWLTRFDPLMRSALRQAARIYVTSRDSLNLIPRKYHYKCEVHLAVGITRQQLGFSRRKQVDARRELRCLYTGRLLEWKGLHLAILAMHRLQAHDAPVRLTIIGDGPAKAALLSLASRLGVANRITWHSWLPHTELQSRLHQHDVFVFPSLRDSGGMAVIEALAHGLPVVCTDLGGPGEIVSNQCGRVIATTNRSAGDIANSLAAHLRELAENPGLRQSLSIGARRRAWEFEFRRLVEAIYQAPSGANPLTENVPA